MAYSNPTSNNHRQIKPYAKPLINYLEGNFNVPTKEYINFQNDINSKSKKKLLNYFNNNNEVDSSPNASKFKAISSIYTPEMSNIRQNRDKGAGSNHLRHLNSKEYTSSKKRIISNRTPNEMDSQISNSLMILDGGTGSEGIVG